MKIWSILGFVIVMSKNTDCLQLNCFHFNEERLTTRTEWLTTVLLRASDEVIRAVNEWKDPTWETKLPG